MDNAGDFWRIAAKAEHEGALQEFKLPVDRGVLGVGLLPLGDVGVDLMAIEVHGPSRAECGPKVKPNSRFRVRNRFSFIASILVEKIGEDLSELDSL